MRVSPILSGAIALALLVATAGCSDSGTQNETGGDLAPRFSGPYAAEFQYSYEKSDSEFIRGVLEDEVITDQEYSEMLAQFDACLSAAGVELKVVNPDGSLEYTYGDAPSVDAANDAMTRCSEESGEAAIGSIYHFIQRNPENLDWNEIIVDCMIDAEIVEPSYTVEDYTRDGTQFPFPLADPDDHPVFEECESDPLGLVD